MSAITILLVAIVALLAGMEGILDEFQFHQPLVACTLIGLVTGHLQEGILLGGSLQMMALEPHHLQVVGAIAHLDDAVLVIDKPELIEPDPVLFPQIDSQHAHRQAGSHLHQLMKRPDPPLADRLLQQGLIRLGRLDQHRQQQSKQGQRAIHG